MAYRNAAREKKVLALREKGLSIKDISSKLGIKNGTTSYYLSKQKKKEGTDGNSISSKESSRNEIEVHQAYAAGRVEEFLRGYAESLGVPAPAFTYGVAGLLFCSSGRS